MSHDIASQRRRLLLLSGLGGSALAAGPARAEVELAPGGHHPPSLDTRLTRGYGVRHPFVGAGMGFVALPSLVAAVSNAGGIGVLGNGIEPPPGTQALIQSIKAV